MVSNHEDYSWHSDGIYRIGSCEQVSLKCWEFPPNFTRKNRKKLYIELLEKAPEYPKQSREYIGNIKDWEKLERRNQEHKDRFLDRRNRKSMEEIVIYKAKKENIAVQKLKSPGRSQPEAKLRQEAMVEMYKEGYGPAQIGRYFNRDKGTVIYAVKKDKKQL